MSHFYSSIVQSSRRTQPTACGSKNTGIQAYVAGWGGSIVTRVYYNDETGKDMFEVTMSPHRGTGDYGVIAHGEVGDLSTVK